MLSSFKVPEKISHIIRLYNICFFTKEAWEKKKKKAGHNINVSVLGKTLHKWEKNKPEKIYLLGPHSATGDLVVIVTTAKVMSAGLQKGAHRLLHIKQ